MNKFVRLATGLDIAPIVAQLAAHPELWNQHTQRKLARNSPHAQMDDIWLRYRAFDELQSPLDYLTPHFAEFYPAWRTLTTLQPLVFDLLARTRCVYLGGILLTRIPPGGKILPHHDRGSWHAEFHNCKVYVPLQSDEGCWNTCEDERVHMAPGDAWSFDNLRTHSVENDSTRDRMTLIVSMRHDV